MNRQRLESHWPLFAIAAGLGFWGFVCSGWLLAAYLFAGLSGALLLAFVMGVAAAAFVLVWHVYETWGLR